MYFFDRNGWLWKTAKEDEDGKLVSFGPTGLAIRVVSARNYLWQFNASEIEMSNDGWIYLKEGQWNPLSRS